MMGTMRVVAKATRVGYEDQRASYTWRSYLFGWITRATAQVLFFAAMGLLVGGDDFIAFAFIGNVVAMAGFMALGSSDTAWERSQGTIPLLVAGPRSLLPGVAGRCGFYVLQGFAEGILIFLVLSQFIFVPPHWWWLPVGLLAVCLSMYGLGLFLGAVAIRRPHVGTFLYNMTFYTLLAIGGVNIPTDVFPESVQNVAAVLPLHHGLIGLRMLLADGAATDAFIRLGLELLVGLGWFVVALIGFHVFAEGGRRDGSIDLGE